MNEPSNSERPADQAKDRINPIVFYLSAVGIAAFAIWTMLSLESANAVINTTLSWISDTFGWYYFVAVVLYLIFVVGIAFSRFGNVRLGREQSRPEFGLLTWGAMLFAAGIGIDLLFFCVSEPVTQYLSPPEGEGETVAAARRALQLTFLHWGLSGWAIYTLVGMSLAFFSYRLRLPLTIRSALYPIIGNRIYGPIGHAVDIAAVLGTVFGIATSLGIGIIQLNFGLNYMFGIPENTLVQASLSVLIVVFAALSAATGVERGIRRLSEFNMLLAVLLLVFVLLSGKTIFLLNALVTNIGDYLSGFVALSFETYAFDRPVDWLNSWTIFFWAWWIAWGPFVGLFLARISRGRTIRQFVAGTLTLPVVFMMAWMSIMGNSAIDLVMSGLGEFGQRAMNNPGSAIYLFMQNFPWAAVTTIVVTILAIVFFVTSGDSGSLVLSNFTSILKDVDSDAPVWMRIVWAAIIGVLTLALLFAGGLDALQGAVVVMGLPFSIVLFLMMFGVYKALKLEALKEASYRVSLAGQLSGRAGGESSSSRTWRQRLARATSYPTYQQVQRFVAGTVKPAMNEIREVLKNRQFTSEIVEKEGRSGHLTLTVPLTGKQTFTYEVCPVLYQMPSFARHSHPKSDYYRLEAYLFEGSQGYDLMGYTKDQVIDDILDQFERHLYFLHNEEQAPGASTPMPDEGVSAAADEEPPNPVQPEAPERDKGEVR